MKPTILVLLLAFLSISVQAQNYVLSTFIGDDTDYWSGAYVYKFISLNGNLSDAQDLPFDFEFYGQSVSTYRIAENGYIVFDAPAGSVVTNNTSLATPQSPNKAIFALWDNFTASVTISTKTYGLAPHRVHQITWAGLNYAGAAPWQDDFTVSINLYESCHDFEVIVIDNNIAPASPFYSQINTTIGCENGTGTKSTQVAASPNYIPSDPGWNEALYEVHRFSWNNAVQNDLALVQVDINNHLAAGSHTLSGHVRNEGANPILSYEIGYQWNGNDHIQVVTASNVSNSKLHKWTHTIPINIAAATPPSELKIWVNRINGATDQQACNDTLVTYITGIHNTPSTHKKVLIEEFTGAWCGHCADGAAVLYDLQNQYDSSLIVVAVHDGDSMELDEGLRKAYSVTGYPNAVVDRQHPNATNDYETESIGRGEWGGRVHARLSSFTPVDVTINHSWNPTTRVIDATVTADYRDNSAGDARIVLMVVEDSLTGVGQGWDQANYSDNTVGHRYYGAGSPIVGFVHQHVLRDYVSSGPFGVDNIIPHGVLAGSSYSHNFQYTLPAGYDADQVTLVAAVVHYMPTNDPMYIGTRGQREVLNATQTYLKNFNSVVTIDQTAPILSVFPNPTQDQITVAIEGSPEIPTLCLYSSTGQLLQTQTSRTMNLHPYPTGVYLLEIRSQQGCYTSKITKIPSK